MSQLLDPGDKQHTFIHVWSVAEPLQAFHDSAVNHRVTGVGRDLCSRQEQQCGHTGLFRALSSQVLKTSQHRDCTTTLGSLCHCLTVLMGKKAFVIFSLNLTCFNLILRPPTFTSVNSLAPSY